MTEKKLNIVFMGTPEFAVPCLKRILEDGYHVVGVFTQPDKPKGRGYKLTPPPVKLEALKQNLPVFQPEKMRNAETHRMLKELEPDLAVVVAYGKLLPKELLDIPKLGCVNVHGSLLPNYRGAAPIQWSVINGDSVTGVTTMFMDIGLDTGDMILKSKTEIGPEETSGQLYDRLALIGADCLSNTLELFCQGSVPRTAQDDSLHTYAPMLDKKIGEIDFNKTATEIHNLIRGLSPWPVAYTKLGDKTVKIHKSRIVGGFTGSIGQLVDNSRYIVACKDGTIEFLVVQPEGKKPMSGEDFLRGFQLGALPKFL